MSHQDFTTVVITKRSAGYQGNKNKSFSNNNPSRKPKAKVVRRYATEEALDFRQNNIGRKFSLALQQARLKKGWKQKDLAHRLNKKTTVINQYESGKCIPSPQLISRMNRVLETKLPSVNKVKKTKKLNGNTNQNNINNNGQQSVSRGKRRRRKKKKTSQNINR